LSWVGAIEGLTWLLSPIMRLFNLPPDAAISVVLGSIRKDGIAIGLLNPSWDGLKIVLQNPVQVLTVVYLAGVLLPCLVTVFTIFREINVKFTLKLLLKQTVAAIVFSLLIAWTGHFLTALFI
jgi:ferrous iron transport protein B